jgi:tetratricopeptide (TPR) repeat protein
VSHVAGRTDDLRRLDNLLGDHARRDVAPSPCIVSVTGTPGVGKTALAVHWAHRVRDRFSDGQLYLRLNGYGGGDPLRPIDALAQALHGLGVPGDRIPLNVDEAAALFRSLLAGRRMLIVLDNARSAGQVRALLPGEPRCLVLVTSRDRLSGLTATDGAVPVGLGVLPAAASLEVLGGVVGNDRIAAEPAAVERLVCVCGGLPLALRICAAHLLDEPSGSIAEYVAELSRGDRLTRLEVQGDASGDVRSAFDVSYTTLGDADAWMFRSLSLLPGDDCTADAAAALAGVDRRDARRLLDGLCAAHLVQRSPEGRYGLHDLLREYAADRRREVDGQDRSAPALGRLLQWYLHGCDAAATMLFPHFVRLPTTTEPHVRTHAFADPADAFAWLDAERAALVAAAGHAVEDGYPTVAWQVADVLRGYFWQSRHVVDWARVVEAGLAAARATGDVQGMAAMHYGRASMRYVLDHHDEALVDYATAADLAAESGWLHGQAAAVGGVGGVHLTRGNLHDALRSTQESLMLDRATGYVAGQGRSATFLATIYSFLGRLDESVQAAREALDHYRSMGSIAGQGYALALMGSASHLGGRLRDAERLIRRGLELVRQVGNPYTESVIQYHLAMVLLADGRATEAAACIDEAMANFTHGVDDREHEADLVSVLGMVHLALGRPARAVECQARALALAQEIGVPRTEALALSRQSAALRGLGQAREATSLAARARRIAHDKQLVAVEADALLALSAARLAAGDLAGAADAAAEARELHRGFGNRLGEARALDLLMRADPQQTGNGPTSASGQATP